MDYLRSFVIGTSGLVSFNNIASLALKDKSDYNYSFKVIALISSFSFSG